jgi:hypothetical protein
MDAVRIHGDKGKKPTMSISSQPTPTPPAPIGRRLSGTTVILSLALAVSTTAAIVLGVLYVTKPGPDSEKPYDQHGTMSPKDRFTDAVIYAVPYRSPPSLKLSSAKRQFKIAKQDEKGFTWEAQAMPEDIKDDKGFGAERLARQYPLWYLRSEGYLGGTGPAIEDFTWEATGLRAK